MSDLDSNSVIQAVGLQFKAERATTSAALDTIHTNLARIEQDTRALAETLDAKLSPLSQAISDTRAKADTTDATTHTHAEQINQLQAALAETQARHDQAHATLDALTHTLGEHDTRADTLTAQLADTNATLSQLRADLDTARTAAAEAEAARDERNRQLQGDLERLAASDRERGARLDAIGDRFNAQTETLAGDLSQLRADLDTARTAAAEAANERTEAERTLHAKLADAQTVLQALSDRINEREQADKAALDAKAQALADADAALADRLSFLQEGQAATATELQAQRDDIHARIEALAAEHRQAQLDTKAKLGQQVQSVADAVRSLSDELSAARASADQQGTQLQLALDAEAEDRKHQASALGERLGSLKTLTDQLATRLALTDDEHAQSMQSVRADLDQQQRDTTEALGQLQAALAEQPDHDDIERGIRAETERQTTAAIERIGRELERSTDALDRDNQARISRAIADAQRELIRNAPQGERGPEGRLSPVRTHVDGDRYSDNALVIRNGGLWQALRETTATPAIDSPDWRLIGNGLAGIDLVPTDDGDQRLTLRTTDGRERTYTIARPRINDRGTWDAECRDYRLDDSVFLNRARWIATRNAPGKPGEPGSGWMVLSMPGQRGPKGERGEQGEPGKQGAKGERGERGLAGQAPAIKDLIAAWDDYLLSDAEGIVIRRFRGDWRTNADYKQGDLYRYMRGIYVADRDHTSAMPPNNPETSGSITLIPSHFGAGRGEPGERGPRGVQGDSGGSPTVVLAEAVTEGAVIAFDANGQGTLADHRNATAMTVQGIAGEDGNAGDTILLRIVPITWTGPALSAGQSLFLGESGQLTRIPPSTGWLRQIAVAIGADLIDADIGPAYYLGA